MGFEEQMDIRRLQKDLEKLTAKVAELEAKVIAVQPDVIKSVCEHEPAYKYGDSSGRNMCKKCGTIF